MACCLLSELPVNSNITLPKDLYDQELIRSTCQNLAKDDIYFDYKEKDQIVLGIFESIKYLFQNKTENDSYTYLATVRKAMTKRDNNVDIMNILPSFRSVWVDGDGVPQQLVAASETENIQEESQAFDGAGVGVQQQFDAASVTENIREDSQTIDDYGRKNSEPKKTKSSKKVHEQVTENCSGGGGSGGGLSDQVPADMASAMAREAARDIKDDDTSFLHRCIIILGVFANLILAILFKLIFFIKNRLIGNGK